MKSIKPVFFLSGAIGLLSVGVLVYVLYIGPDAIHLSGRSLGDLFDSSDIAPLIIIPVVLLISGGIMWTFFRTLYPVKIKNGISVDHGFWQDAAEYYASPQYTRLNCFQSLGLSHDARPGQSRHYCQPRPGQLPVRRCMKER